MNEEPRTTCLNCGSASLEELAESGHYWMYCRDCDYEHPDHFVK